ncbi:hypothetical protein [Hyphomonas sp.]|uniref:hypothetical protein n=1 Tax=Hyphomonas sp. TaxID=87 RepID=UPI0032EC3834
MDMNALPHAVLTGDLIGSTELTAKEMEAARESLLAAIALFVGTEGELVVGQIEFFRGDTWQVLLHTPAKALRLALFLRARLRAETTTDTRISIGIGTVSEIHPHRISLSRGEAFILSGHALDGMTGYFDLTAALPDRAGPLASWLPVVMHLCSGLARNWTKRQAEITWHALMSKYTTHESIAEHLMPPVRKQTVTESLRGANWRALQEPIVEFEQTDWKYVLNRHEMDK